MKLHQVIAQYFQLSDLRLLCANLHLDFEEIKGENKHERIIDIIKIFQTNGRLAALQDYLQKERPHIQWQPFFDNLPNYQNKKQIKEIPVQLPLRPKYFTGRETEIEQLKQHLYPGKKVTLWAAGGMGKTTIAAETIYRLRDEGELFRRFPDGVIFFSFYGRSQNEDLYEHIIRTLAPDKTEFTFEKCFRCLSGKKLLLIYDGSEEASDFEKIMQLQGQNGLLITTRDRRSQGGVRIEIGLLPMSQAVQLLSDWSGGSINNEEAKAICQEIGRLPLAVRIAGFYLDESGEFAADYLEMLQETPIRELSQGDSQYESVEILLKRTFEKLDETTQLVLALMGRLALLPFGQDPLTAVVERRALREALNQLNRYGLVMRSKGEIQLTHALIHRYARQRLPLERENFLQMARYFLHFIQTESKKSLAGFQNLHPYRPHIMVVLKHCMVQSDWELANQIALKMAAQQGYLDLQGFNQLRVQMLEIGVQAARHQGNRHDESTHFENLGAAYHALGIEEKAIENYQQALSIVRQSGDHREEGIILRYLGVVHHGLGKMEQAIDFYNQALDLARQNDDRQGEGRALGNLGVASCAMGHLEKGIHYYEQAMDIYRETADRQGEAAALGNSGKVYRDLGQLEKSIDYLEQALKIFSEIGHRQGEGAALGNIGISFRQLGQIDKAINYFERALLISREIGDPRSEGKWLGNLGSSYKELKQVDLAISHHEQALALAREVGNRDGEGFCLGNLATAYRDSGDVDRAIQLYEQALTISREIADRKNEGFWLGHLGTAHRILNQIEEASGYYEQALAIAYEIGHRQHEAEHAWELGLLFKDTNPRKAVELMGVMAQYKRDINHPNAEADAARVAEIAARIEL